MDGRYHFVGSLQAVYEQVLRDYVGTVVGLCKLGQDGTRSTVPSVCGKSAAGSHRRRRAAACSESHGGATGLGLSWDADAARTAAGAPPRGSGRRPRRF